MSASAARSDGVYVPPPAFSFRVDIEGAEGDTSFAEVSGLQVDLETEDLVEGGQNRYVHKLPVRTRYANLVLKRGVVAGNSALARWVSQALSRGLVRQNDAKTILVKLLDAGGGPLIVWKVFGAYPLRWEHGTLDAMSDAVFTETIELTYQFFQRQ